MRNSLTQSHHYTCGSIHLPNSREKRPILCKTPSLDGTTKPFTPPSTHTRYWQNPHAVDQLSSSFLLRIRARALISVHHRSSAVSCLPPGNCQNAPHNAQLDTPDQKPLCRGESIKKNRATMDATHKSWQIHTGSRGAQANQQNCFPQQQEERPSQLPPFTHTRYWQNPHAVDQLFSSFLLRIGARALISVHHRSSAVSCLPPRNGQNAPRDAQLPYARSKGNATT